MRRHTTHWLRLRTRRCLASWDNSGRSRKRVTTTNWRSLLVERGLCRRGACPSRSNHLKGCVRLGSHRTQATQNHHPSHRCIDRRVLPPLSTAGDIPSGINSTIRSALQSTPTRASSHRSYLSGDHHDDPTIHTHHSNILPLPHHWYLRPLLSMRRTNIRQ